MEQVTEAEGNAEHLKTKGRVSILTSWLKRILMANIPDLQAGVGWALWKLQNVADLADTYLDNLLLHLIPLHIYIQSRNMASVKLL